MAPKESSSNNPDDSCEGHKSQSRFLLPSNGHVETSSAPSDPIERTAWTFGHKTTLELDFCNWGSETGPDFKGCHIGNSEPRGFGHVSITLDDMRKACKRFESLGVGYVKRPADGHVSITLDDMRKACKRFESLGVGKIKDIAFIKYPDDYCIEIFDTTTIAKSTAAAAV